MMLLTFLLIPLPVFFSLACLWVCVREIDKTSEFDTVSLRQSYQLAWFHLILIVVFTCTNIWNLPGLLETIQIHSI